MSAERTGLELPEPRADEARISAPGKLFLAGEYAVLEPGRAALVAAIDERLVLSLRPDPEPIVELWHKPSRVALIGELTRDAKSPIAWTSEIPSELRFAARAATLAMRLTAEDSLPPLGFHAAFENDFALDLELDLAGSPEAKSPDAANARSRAAKPGLGGSAAATVLAVRAASLAQHRRLSPKELLALAAASHWIEQGGSGSGADVAASALKGVLEVVTRHPLPSPDDLWNGTARAMLESPLVEATPIELPSDLHLIAAWSGEGADTRVLIKNVRVFAAANPAAFAMCIERISSVAGSLKSALGAAALDFADQAARESVLDSVRAGAAAMAALGEAASSPIVTPSLEKICALAAAAGAAGKPSGAGGGDCAIIFAFSETILRKTLGLLHAQKIPAAVVGVASR